MAVKKHHIGYFIGLFIIVILAGIIIWLCYCVSLAFHDDYADKYTLSETDDTIKSSIIKGAVVGEEFEITEAQFNTYINDLICSDGSSKNTFEKTAIYFHENEPSELYAKIRLMGYNFGFYSKITFNLDTSENKLHITLSDAKIGRLDIPEKLLSKAISEMLKDKEDIFVYGTTIAIKSSYEYKLKNISIPIELEEFTPHESYISCRTNNLSLETLNSVKDYLKTDEGKEELKEIFKTGIDNVKDKISSWIEQYKQ